MKLTGVETIFQLSGELIDESALSSWASRLKLEELLREVRSGAGGV